MTDRAITIQHMIAAWNNAGPDATDEDRMGAAMDVAQAGTVPSDWAAGSIDRLKDELAEAVEVLVPFATFIAFLKAGRELDGDDPLKHTDDIVSFSGNGASFAISTADFYRASTFIARHAPQEPGAE